MKKTIILLFVTIFFLSCKENKTHNGLPVIKATKINVDFKVGNQWTIGAWGISPDIESDTLPIVCFKEKEFFKFRTNIDSIEFDIQAGKTKSFYVALNDSLYAHTIIKGVAFNYNTITYDAVKSSGIKAVYQTEENEYLLNLKKEYPLNFITKEMTDKEAVLAVLNWTSNRWVHSGNNSPKKNDAISILKEAETGGRFPCFAYAIVLRDQLNALGFKARTVYLKTEDARTRKSSPGHVATEVFLNDLKKWVFVDGQFNILPTLDGIPLNAIEFQKAITNNYNNFKLESIDNNVISKRGYVSFVYDYLFYIDTTLDNRYDKNEEFKIEGNTSMMLVPEGAKKLSYINFWKMDVNNYLYTNSIKDFYSKPVN